jgi:hypothetical protein
MLSRRKSAHFLLIGPVNLKPPRHHLQNSDSHIFPLTLAAFTFILHDGFAEATALPDGEPHSITQLTWVGQQISASGEVRDILHIFLGMAP